MALTPEQIKAFDFAADATKQLITVATGVVTATVLFSTGLDARSREWALASWIVLTVSVVFGLFTLLNLTGNLFSAATPNINAAGIRRLSQTQIVLFVAGIGLVVVFGIFAARANPVAAPQPITVTCTAPQTAPKAATAKP
jgi:hypothetical protein